MNKTVTINISGIIFHIEEDAYEKLSKYLNTIKGYFKNTEGCDEIMADIELRIAELLKDKTSNVKQVVLMLDVDNVMEVMGKPEDFAGDGEPQSEEKKDESTEETVYNKGNKKRRIFRDNDESMVGGVCAGIANYFDTDPLWIRLAWVAFTLLGGAGILVYIILWIVIPPAKTTAEKLEMRGEPININNIKRNFEEESQNFKKKVNEFGKEAKAFGESFRSGERRNIADKLADFITAVFGGIIKVIGKVLAFFLVVICVILMIGLTGSIFGLSTINDIPVSNFSNYIFETGTQSDLAIIGLFLFVGIPLLMLIYAAVKALLGIRAKNRIVNISSMAMWVVGLLILIYVGYVVSDEFREQSKTKQTIYVTQPKNNLLYVKVKNGYLYDDFDMSKRHRKYRHWTKNGYDVVDSNGTCMLIGYPEFNVRESTNDSFYVVINTYARGASRKIALDNAKKIQYSVTQNDSVIELQPFFEIDKNQKIRGQRIDVIVYVPKGKMIYFSKSVRPIMYDVENVHDIYDGDMINRRWIMTENGLNCIDCDGLELKDNIKPGVPILPPPPMPPIQNK